MRPARFLLALLALASVGALAWAVSNYLTVLMSLPASNPLAVDTGQRYTSLASTGYTGRCVAVRAYASGAAFAATAESGSLRVHGLWPDGRSATTTITVQGDVSSATFSGAGYLLVWVSDRATGAGSVNAYGPLGETWFAAPPAGPAWKLATEHPVVALLPLAGGNTVVIGAAADGTPANYAVLKGDGQVISRAQLDDGLFTAWDNGGPAAVFGLAGAVFDAAAKEMAPFVRTYQANGTAGGSAALGSPAARIAVGPSGKHFLAATTTELTMIGATGEQVWSRRFPGANVRSVHVFPDGRSLVSGPDSAIVFDDRGTVLARWATQGQGVLCRPAPAEQAVLNLPGGCALIDSSGRVVGLALWDGGSQLIGVESSLAWLVRADGANVTLFGRAR